MDRVLILSAPYGSGHDRVALALARALEAEGAGVEVADHFQRFVSPMFARASRAVYLALLRRAPWFWGCAFAFGARIETQSSAMAGMNRLGARALARELATGRHDAVVHVHPTPAGAMSWLRARGVTDIPHAVVLTDFVVHSQWIYPHVDRYFVPAQEIREGFVARGIEAGRVVVSGMPIDPGFATPVDRTVVRGELGLAPGPPVALVMGGMHGSLGRIAEVCELLAQVTVPFHALVVCGVAGELADGLRLRFAGDRRFRILGYVAEMARVMGAADLLVTKGGGVTCAEALALGLPLVFYRSLPGQERANEAFLERAGAAVRVPGPERLAAHLARLLGDPTRRADLGAGARRLGRVDAGRHVAKEVLELARHPPGLFVGTRGRGDRG